MSPLYSADEVAGCVERFRDHRPHVHCITNNVAQHFTANVLLATGATPSMTIAKDEILDFVDMADALLVNLGTMDAERTTAVEVAVAAANSDHKPWALDPVFVHGSAIRLKLARKLVAENPAIIRCNAVEAEALFEGKTPPCVLAQTGAVDKVVGSGCSISITNGSSQMDRITAMGCALTALLAGFVAVEEDTLLAATSALVLFGLAGDCAEKVAQGPGTFTPHFLDALSILDRDDIQSGARLQ